MSKQTDSDRLTVLSWLTDGLTPTQALYRLLVREWDMDHEYVAEAQNHSSASHILDTVEKTDDLLGADPTDRAAGGQQDDGTYYCPAHDERFDTQSAYANHVKWDHHDGRREQ